MKVSSGRLALAAIAALLSSTALAQTVADDGVVVMRRIVSKPIPSFAWRTGEWIGATTCGEAIPSTRTVRCSRQEAGSVTDVDDSMCTGAKPASSAMVSNLSGCSSSWKAAEWSAWSSTCGKDATRTRAVDCQRTDGLVLPDASCTGIRPPSSETKDVFESCSYSWGTDQEGPWSSTCSSDAIRSRAVFCARQDGERAEASKCDAAMRPGEQEHAAVTTSCTAFWDPDAWGSWSTTCGQGTRTRTLSCRRKDPVSGIVLAGKAPESACEGLERPTTSETGRSTETCPARWVVRVEEFLPVKSLCVGGKLTTRTLFECGYFGNSSTQQGTYGSDLSECQRYDPKPTEGGYGSSTTEYACSIDNANALTLPATDSSNFSQIAKSPTVRILPGILSQDAALAEARQMCRPLDVTTNKDGVDCMMVAQTNASLNQTRIAVGINFYGAPNMVPLATGDSGWQIQKRWMITFAGYSGNKTSAAGITVPGAATPPSGKIKPGVFGCGQSIRVNEFSQMGTLFTCGQ